MKLRVIQGGCYPTNRKVIPRLLRGEMLTKEERGDVELRVGEVLDGDALDPRVLRSLIANEVVEEVEADG